MIENTAPALQNRIGVKEYFAVCVRRRLVIAVAFFSVVLATFILVSRIPDIYESFSTLVTEDQHVVVNQMMAGNNRSLSFYEGILNSRTFLESVVDSLGVDAFTVVNPKVVHTGAIELVRSSLSLRKTSFASFLSLTARTGDGNLAYTLACVATELFLKRCREVESEESRRAVTETEKQLELIRTNLEESEYNLRSFSDTAGQVEEGTTPELRSLSEAYAASLAQLGVKEADLNAEKDLLVNLEQSITPDGSSRSTEFLALRKKLSDLEKEKLRLENLGIRLSGFSTVGREIQQVEQELLKFKKTKKMLPDLATMRQWQELRKSVAAKEGDLALFKRRLGSYEKAINSYKKGNTDLLSKSLELMRLKRSKEVYENLYSILLEKAEEERIKSAASGVGIKVVDYPALPMGPIAKNQSRFYAAALFLGLLFGLGIAFLIEYNDTTIKTNDDIERFLQLPVLGTIPHIFVNKKSDVTVKRQSSRSKKGVSVSQYPRNVFNFEGNDSVSTEAYRSLRTNILFASPDNPLKVLALTSAGPSEGKSLTISNLALAYAQMGKKTLLVDTDLRRPVMHHIFGQPREPGFSNLFMEDVSYESIIRSNVCENLSLITAGMFTPNPAELLGSHKLIRHIDYFRNNYDMVFFDTPPIVAVTDATIIGTKMDGLLVVIKSNHTDREILIRAVNILRNVGVKVVGSVLNDINLSHRYSSYGYYKYYYHYYKTNKD